MKKINETQLYDVAELFKMFADSTRIRILYSLFEKEKPVNAIAEELNISLSAISHQLRFLKTGKLVGFRKEGKLVYYYLVDDHVKTMIEMACEHITEK